MPKRFETIGEINQIIKLRSINFLNLHLTYTYNSYIFISIFLKITNVTHWDRSFQQINWSLGLLLIDCIGGYLRAWISQCSFPKHLGCILEKWLPFKEPQHFWEGITESIWALWYKNRAKATSLELIWICFEHNLKSNYARNSWTFEIKGKLTVFHDFFLFFFNHYTASGHPRGRTWQQCYNRN